MTRASKYASALTLSFALMAVPAHAATFDLFTFNSPDITGPLTASILASPTPASSVSGVSFDLAGVSATFEGNTFTGDVTFFTAGGAGGGGATFSGPLLFSGPVSSPTFLLGSFPLSGTADIGAGPQLVVGTLTISQPNPVPEPAPLVMAGTGVLALLMWIVRRRRSHFRSGEIVC